MIRDQFYRDIIVRLNATLHEEAFERCAQDLLRTIYPTLVPIRGGNDGGMDGVTADTGEGSLVLVTTVGKDVKRNLNTSIKSMLNNKNPRRRVIIATSRSLSHKRQQQLRQDASNIGFVVEQIYEQAAIANLLYRSPQWCKELLDLTGDPPPLSIIPRSGRPTITNVLIGRERDARWLADRTGDRLLLGQPGSGKTFLVSTIAKQKGWLFIVTNNLGRIANGIRSQEPSALVQDDAHVDPEFLKDLTRMRKEIAPELPLITVSWPGARDQMQEALHLSNNQIYELEPLTRPEMMAVLEAAGLTGPQNLIYQILNQAAGRPGLAITLAHACASGNSRDLEEVMRGDRLIASISTTFERLVGKEVRALLAAFSVGGRSGMKMQVVADYLRLPLADVQSAITQLSAGGVVSDVDGKHLSVQPPELCYGLIRDTFFSGATSLDIASLLERAPCLRESSKVLTRAMHCGASIPPLLIQRLLERANSPAAWEVYAWLGPDQAGFALARHPELLGSLIEPTLNHIPEDAIPRLLDKATGDNRDWNSYPDHALRRIQDWVKRGRPGTSEPMTRRRSLIDAASLWLTDGGNSEVGLRAMTIALTPAFEYSSTDPVLGDKVTLHFGILSLPDIKAVAGLWPRIIYCLEKKTDDSGWNHVLDLIGDWVFPQRHSIRGVPEGVEQQMQEVAKEMLCDFVNIAYKSAGVMQRAVELAEELKIKLKYSTVPEFETLFPSIPLDLANYAEFAMNLDRSIKKLAERWARERPRLAIRRINELESQARSVDIRNRQTPRLVYELAQMTTDPLEWIESIIEEGASADLVAPFVLKAANVGASGWESVAIKCLSRNETRCSTASAILTIHDPPLRVLEAALQSLSGMSAQIETLCLQGSIPMCTVQELLSHEDDAIASSAAIGIWVAEPRGSVPDSLLDEWTGAVLRGSTREYWLGEIFKENPALGCEFLRVKIRSNSYFWSHNDLAIREALKALDPNHRQSLLRELPDECVSSDLVAMLVGNDSGVFKWLLSMPRLERHHLAPLRGRVDVGKWIELAKLAMDAGIELECIAVGVFPNAFGWIGKESDMWNEWIEWFQAVSMSDDRRVRQVAERGVTEARNRRDIALKGERAEETFPRP